MAVVGVEPTTPRISNYTRDFENGVNGGVKTTREFMPAHLKKRGGRWYIIDGRLRFSLKTDNEAHAVEALDRYRRDRLGISKIAKADSKTRAFIKEFGQPDQSLTLKRIRFPCVYACIQNGEIVYIGSSVNGFGRILHTSHPIFEAGCSDEDDIVFWITNSVGEARELEAIMIRCARPKFNNRAARLLHRLKAVHNE